MLRNIGFFLGGLLLLVAGIFGYRKYIAEPALVTIEQLVAEDALWVYHSKNFPEDWANMQTSPLGRLMASLPDIQNIKPGVSALDSAALASLLNNRSTYVVSHVVGNDDMGFSFYVDLASTRKPTDWKNLTAAVQSSPEWKVEGQQYQGMSIQEWVYQPQQTRFSWIHIDNFLIGSFTPFLVEDQIRRLGSTEVSAQSWRKMLTQSAFSQHDQGDVIINGKQLSRFFSLFATHRGEHTNFLTDALADCLMLDLSIEDNQWLFSGFGQASPNEAYLSVFEEQSAASFGLSNYLPSRTATVRQWTSSEASSWLEKYFNFLSQTKDSTDLLSMQRHFQDRTGSTLTDWFSWAGNELGVITLESSSGTLEDHLIIVEIADATALEQRLETFSNNSDSLSFQEAYAGHILRNLPDSPLPNLLTGNFSQSLGEYFWYRDASYWVLSSSLNALKRLISDQVAETTWSKSPRQSRFLERAINPANLSLLVDMPHYRKQWVSGLSPKWGEWAQSQEAELNQLNKIALQFSTMGEEYYTNMVVTYQTEDQPSSGSFVTANRQRIDTAISSKPFVVRGGDQKIRVAVQDQSKVVHLLDPVQRAITWSDSTRATLVGDIIQINLPESAPPNYVWATDSTMHVVDRSGNYVNGYPFYLPEDIRVQYLSVFDYERNGNYRFLITDPLGQLWLFNADRDNLEGWNPLSLTAPLAEAPQHIRVRGKDCIVALLENGLLYLLNRRGEAYPGFPVELGQACENPLSIKIGNNFSDSELTTVTESGELISLNLVGTLLKREQLLRPSSNTHFLLCPDRLGKDYIIVRQDEQRLSVLDKTGRVWFEQSYFTPGALSRDELSVQYYNFGTDNQVVAISDKVQEFTYLFDQQGKLFNNRPIESRGEIALLYSEARNQYQLYRVYENELAEITF
ncbi:hypothetical protein [Tunicatimonas pelagia]|uniref:hypothetical protein n=1 Tax=Tunicatimonas pelagia TaxID=931531 RepID=UPI002665483D|nr:hypothetical protein [Tunicatimonas pelagia]WKN44435.1 hypothetical protein P0M28_05590 [Tunicatimonas pelagia]